MDATGLEKGGIYNPFRSKDELAAAAFEHNVDVVGELLRSALAEAGRDAVARLLAILDVYRGFAASPAVPGGCPMLNAAVETDDTHPALRALVRSAMDRLRVSTIERVVARGVERGELSLPSGVTASAVATVFVSTIEGALMLGQLYGGDPTYMTDAAAHLEAYVRSLEVAR
jgi:AcrR family transcriptional regulator